MSEKRKKALAVAKGSSPSSSSSSSSFKGGRKKNGRPWRRRFLYYWRTQRKTCKMTIEKTWKRVKKINFPEVLNVHINKIYKKLTTNQTNKLKFQKVSKKSNFFLKVNFALLERKILLKKKILFTFIQCTWNYERSYKWDLQKKNYKSLK